MSELQSEGIGGRGVGRRKEDILLRDRLRKHAVLFQVGQAVTSVMNLTALFEVIMDQTNKMMGTLRSTLFLYDPKTDQLWSLVATGMKRDEIRIPSGHGVAGWVFQHKTPVKINDAYSDPRFYSEVDRRSGFVTRNILCIPILNQPGNSRRGSKTGLQRQLLPGDQPFPRRGQGV